MGPRHGTRRSRPVSRALPPACFAQTGGQAWPGLGAILIAAQWPKARSSSPLVSYMFTE